MLPVISALLAFVAGLFRSRASLGLEHLALRHQLAVDQQTVERPRLRSTDRVLWAWLARLWPGWRDALAFVQPRTVIAWQPQRVRDYWRRVRQQAKPGRPAVAQEVRELIQALWPATPTWGAPRIVGERRQLGLDGATSTVETSGVRLGQPPSPTGKTCLHNHVQDVVALDCLVVPTVTCQVLCVLVILAHHRRRVVHVTVTAHPTAAWTTQQVGAACPWDEAPRDLLRARDRLYSAWCRQRVRRLGIEDVITAPRSPGQTPDVDRLLGSLRREGLDHVIVLHERHLRRLLTGDLPYDHDWRTHRALAMDGPVPRPVQRPEVGLIREVPG